ncbi:MAG: radical SAM family heme chaperone HemW [Proteobacteria bacterium]|nr:radical SAM family heme chaperone HemW [Pseudomonadota bacterium]
MKPPPLSLYVHLPWCVRKCPYCDFNSHTAGDAPPKRRYVQALLKDLARESKRARGRVLTSIFLGGGTPSLFSPAEIDHLLQGVRALFTLAEGVEITMEANPGTVECGSPAGYRDAGVTRLSVGAQSFDDGLLSALGRIHSSDDIVRAVREAQDSGFDNINIDVMHSLPGQTIELAMADLIAAIELQPAHISWYQLTLEPNTVFHARPPANLPDDDLAFEIQEHGQALIADHGYTQYEISAYAQDGRQCKHNLNYWLFGDYLAVGAGAHGKLTTQDEIYRYQKPANPLQYMKFQETDDPEITRTVLDRDDLMFEFMLNALRLNDGFAENVFLQRTGLSTSDLIDATRNARQRGLIERDNNEIWKPTELGGRFLNDLQSEFIVQRA